MGIVVTYRPSVEVPRTGIHPFDYLLQHGRLRVHNDFEKAFRRVGYILVAEIDVNVITHTEPFHLTSVRDGGCRSVAHLHDQFLLDGVNLHRDAFV